METRNRATDHAMPLIPDPVVFQKRLAALPIITYHAGEIVFAAGSKTGRLLILRKGAVAIVKEAIEAAKVTEPGAVFGELSALLDQPHTADVRVLETSQFHVADAAPARARPDRAPLRCDGVGTASRRRQSCPH